MASSNTRTYLGKAALFIALVIIAVLVIVPLLIMILGSFKDALEVTYFDLRLPEKWLFENYRTVVIEGRLVRAFINSMVITVLSVALTIFLSSMASFILARKKTRASEFLYYFFFIGSLAPMQVIPTIKIFQTAGLYGSYLSAILIYCATNLSFSCFLYVGFIKSVPKGLDEAAFIEGASLFRMFYSIIFPLLKPINITIMILIFMGIWNDINIPIYFLSNPSKWTMPMSVYGFFGRYSSNWNYVFADLTLTALPVVILYLLAQRYIVSGLTVGAMKE